MTTLDAINYGLSRVGLMPVTILETGTLSEAGRMEAFLDQKREEISSEGWHFNKRVNVELTPDIYGHILLAQIGEVLTSGRITVITASATPVVTSTAHKVLAGAYVTFEDTNSTPTLEEQTLTITAISAASPTEITTSAAHGLANGALVTFAGVNSTPAFTGPYAVSSVTATTFTVPVAVTVAGTTGTGVASFPPYIVASIATNTFTLTTGQVTTTVAGTTGTYTALNPGTVLEIDADERNGDSSNVAMRGDRLVDLDDQTDVFSGSVTVKYTLLLAFDDIKPPAIQVLIAAEAAVAFNDSHGLAARSGMLRDNALRARVRARQADSRMADTNVLDSDDVRAVLGHRGDYEGRVGGPW